MDAQLGAVRAMVKKVELDGQRLDGQRRPRRYRHPPSASCASGCLAWALTMTPWCLGRPTIEGKTARGASSPAKPAFTMPDPLSHTMALTSPSSAA